jgi:FkbM family methyltransferase
MVKKMISQNDSVLEMGGSLGILTAIIAERVRQDGKVVMIEASKENASIASGWLNKYRNIKVIHGIAFPVWLNNKSIVSKFEARDGSLGGRVNYIFLKEDEASLNSNPNYSIKDICELAGFKPNSIIADIEGAENIVLTIKPNYPEFIKKIIIELHPNIYGYDNQKSIIKVFEAEGFRLLLNEGNVFGFVR